MKLPKNDDNNHLKRKPYKMLSPKFEFCHQPSLATLQRSGTETPQIQPADQPDSIDDILKQHQWEKKNALPQSPALKIPLRNDANHPVKHQSAGLPSCLVDLGSTVCLVPRFCLDFPLAWFFATGLLCRFLCPILDIGGRSHA